MLYNYTWLIINEAGDIASSTNAIGTSPPWSPLRVDLCALALGAATAWGTPDDFLPRSGLANPANKQTYDTSYVGGGLRPDVQTSFGCGNPTARSNLRSEVLYACPGGHRDRSLSSKCGDASYYFCKAWGCETTGDGYWNPSSSWDYITVRKAPSSDNCRASGNPWCNPLLVSFTQAGQNIALWQSPHRWGLRLYTSGRDPGLLFQIQLRVETPKPTQPLALGPNVLAVPAAPPPIRPAPPRPPPSPTPGLPRPPPHFYPLPPPSTSSLSLPAPPLILRASLIS